MGFVESRCDRCGALNRESCNAWAYGSPIRICPKCNMEYFDPQWRELALDGKPKKKSAKAYLLFALLFLLAGLLIGFYIYTTITTKGYYNIKAAGTVFVCAIGTIGCLVMFFRIVTGFEGKEDRKYYDESVERLQNKDYVAKLIKFGYNVPEEFK